MFLYFFFNKDAAGQSDNKVYFEVLTDNNINQSGSHVDQVILSDDSGELRSVRKDQSGQHYIGDFQYWHNTDGGIIGPFRGEEFSLAVRATSHSPVGEDLTEPSDPTGPVGPADGLCHDDDYWEDNNRYVDLENDDDDDDIKSRKPWPIHEDTLICGKTWYQALVRVG